MGNLGWGNVTSLTELIHPGSVALAPAREPASSAAAGLCPRCPPWLGILRRPWGPGREGSVDPVRASVSLRRALLLFAPVRPWASFQNAADFIVQPDALFLCCFHISTLITATVKAHFSSVWPAHPPFITAAHAAVMATHVSPAFLSSWSPGQMPCREPLALSATVQFLKKEKNGSVFPRSIII